MKKTSEQKLDARMQCPKCGGNLTPHNHAIAAACLGILGTVSIIAAIVFSLRSPPEEVIVSIVCLVVLGLLFIYRAFYWSERKTYKCKRCGYSRVTKGR